MNRGVTMWGDKSCESEGPAGNQALVNVKMMGRRD